MDEGSATTGPELNDCTAGCVLSVLEMVGGAMAGSGMEKAAGPVATDVIAVMLDAGAGGGGVNAGGGGKFSGVSGGGGGTSAPLDASAVASKSGGWTY
jgi:hypothetical protein